MLTPPVLSWSSLDLPHWAEGRGVTSSLVPPPDLLLNNCAVTQSARTEAIIITTNNLSLFMIA